MKLSLPNAVTTRFARQVLVAQKNSPQLLFAGGIALMGATVVSACRGTLKLEAVLNDIHQDREDIQRVADRNPDKYSDRDIAKLNAYVSMRGMARITKLYLPALSFGVAAVACLTGSNHILSKRNAGLSAALAATDKALKDYRGRVVDQLGEDKELELWRNEKTEMKPVLDDEGRETKSKKKVTTGGGRSPYACLWGQDTSTEWDPQPEYNLAKLRAVQNYCTMMLNRRGHLFLNDVFDELGMDRTPTGAVVGWLKDGEGDGYVDFGVLSRGEEIEFLHFVTGHEAHIWLDFNVDGEIWRNI